MSLETFEKLFQSTALQSYPKHSRVHPLPSFDLPGIKSFVKRDDELTFSMSGSKVRKYLSLLPYLISQSFKEAIIIGSPFSNNVLSLSQLLRENRIRPILFLLGEKKEPLFGNFLFSSLVVDPMDVHWIKRDEWAKVEMLAYAFAKNRKVKAAIIPEGSSCEESLIGSLTLALDIIRNEKELGYEFNHLFIDSGTGMMAAALILGFAYLQKKSHIHVIQLAQKKEDFPINKWKNAFEKFLTPLPSLSNYTIYTPENAPSFGSVNRAVTQMILEMARTEGILTDPVYTAKLFYEGRKILSKKNLKGNALFIHSGGGLALSGFQDLLAEELI